MLVRSFRKAFIFACFLLTFSAYSQHEYSVYIDESNIIADSADAKYIRLLSQVNDSTYKITDYHLDGHLYQTGFIKIALDKTPPESGRKNKKPQNDSIESVNRLLEALDKRPSNHGIFTQFYKNGNRKFLGYFHNDRKVGQFKYWHPNGAFKGDFVFPDSTEIDHEFKVLNFYDSLGNQLVINGEGEFYEVDDSSEGTGPISGGVKEGEWSGSFNDGMSSFKETYNSGRLEHGVSYDSTGQKYEYTEIMEQPAFRGGMKAFYRHVANTMEYPVSARRKGIQGRVYVQFIVDKEGKTTEVETVKGIYEACDKEAEKATDSANDFSPGKYRGQLAKVKMILPIIFRLH